MGIKTPIFAKKAGTGIEGLDVILRGGLPKNRLILVTGNPGSGKTTLALQFLLEGAKNGEEGLYITLSETREEIDEIARSHCWDLKGIKIFELSALEQQMSMESQNTLFHPADVELTQTTQLLLEQINKAKPKRLVLDSLSELRLLAQNSLRYRRQLLGLKQAFSTLNCSVLVLDDLTGDAIDQQVESIAHGVISLDHRAPEYGSDRRRLIIKKLRGTIYTGGHHDYEIRTGGIALFPRLVAQQSRGSGDIQQIKSSIPELDSLLGGGLDEGTSTLLMGPSGIGKSTIALLYAVAAAKEGKKAVCFTFDETEAVLKRRLRGLNIPFEKYLDDGLIMLHQVDPGELSPGEFACTIKEAVEKQNAKVVIVDSLNGYLNAMPEDKYLVLQMHELLSYLNQQNVLSILVFTQTGMMGPMKSPVDVTYLSDTAILFRYFEATGELRRAVSVVKKRTGQHEPYIREFKLDNGVKVGEPLSEFQGVFSGTPQYVGQPAGTMSK